MDAERRSELAKNPTTAERNSDRELVIRRTFDAPARLVYEAWTRPELFQRWWAPKSMNMSLLSVEMDVRVGGQYKWRWRSDDKANEFGFAGTFREVEPPARLVHTEAYDAGTFGAEYPGEPAIVTVTFTEDGGVTTVTTLVDYGSKETRDAALATGMTDGMEQSYQLLDRLLEDPAGI